MLAVLCAVVIAVQAGAQDVCVGDCDGNGMVSIAELLTGVNIAFDPGQLARCPAFDLNVDGGVAINELLGAVNGAVQGCRAAAPTPTLTPEPSATLSPDPTPTLSPAPTPTPTQQGFAAEAADFECLTNWTRIRHFRIANALGHLDEALAVANGDMPPPYPIGTIIQLVPTEAMVKRGAGFFPEASDWEFFVLSPAGGVTQIIKRGRGEVVNLRTTSCFGCHGAASQKDFICENGNGCVALGIPESIIDRLQNGDPRCPASAAGP